MDAALITRMFSNGYSASSEYTKDVLIKKDTGFKDVLSDKVRKDVNSNMDVKSRDELKEKIDNKKNDSKKIDSKKNDNKKVKNKKDDSKEETDKINEVVEQILEKIENKKDVENIDELEDIVSEITNGKGLANEDLLKIQEVLQERLSENIVEVGPQSVETDKKTLNEFEKFESKLESLAEKLGMSSEDVEGKDVESNMSETDSEGTGFDFMSDLEKSDVNVKDVKGKEGKFNITDLRKRGTLENKVEQPELNIQDVDNEISGFEDIKINDVVMSRTDELQEQIDILKQVSEQVDVNLLEDKSEMIIKLKPDNLGKVTMQISIENGNVTAKFLAESQKVKEILESSMQDLKDHLAQQGMVIQDLSVSVGNENKQQQMFEQKNVKSFGKRQDVGKVQNGSYVTGSEAYEENEANLSNYWPDSTVSFSA